MTLGVQEAAEQFWTLAGGPPAGFPRELRRSVALALPLAVMDVPRLRVRTINEWLSARGASPVLAAHDRNVRGCLVVGGEMAIVFLDATDPDDERRFSLAHEVAHFL